MPTFLIFKSTIPIIGLPDDAFMQLHDLADQIENYTKVHFSPERFRLFRESQKVGPKIGDLLILFIVIILMIVIAVVACYIKKGQATANLIKVL